MRPLLYNGVHSGSKSQLYTDIIGTQYNMFQIGLHTCNVVKKHPLV